MKPLHLLAIAATALLLGGCIVTSVYPFYAEKDVFFEPALAGCWTNPSEAQERWEFAAVNTNGYKLNYVSKDSTNVMEATLFKLQKNMFLDLFGADVGDSVQPPPIPSHLLLRIQQTKPTLKMAPMNYEWLAGFLTNNPKAIRHEVIKGREDSSEGRLVLTADTADLQKFIVKHLDTAEAWKEAIELTRDPSGSKPAK